MPGCLVDRRCRPQVIARIEQLAGSARICLPVLCCKVSGNRTMCATGLDNRELEKLSAIVARHVGIKLRGRGSDTADHCCPTCENDKDPRENLCPECAATVKPPPPAPPARNVAGPQVKEDRDAASLFA